MFKFEYIFLENPPSKTGQHSVVLTFHLRNKTKDEIKIVGYGNKKEKATDLALMGLVNFVKKHPEVF